MSEIRTVDLDEGVGVMLHDSGDLSISTHREGHYCHVQLFDKDNARRLAHEILKLVDGE